MSKVPHKHAELIKAWADGAVIQQRHLDSSEWSDTTKPGWYGGTQYRVKPVPDTVLYATCNTVLPCDLDAGVANCVVGTFLTTERTQLADLRLTFDGTTGKIKSAEVL